MSAVSSSSPLGFFFLIDFGVSFLILGLKVQSFSSSSFASSFRSSIFRVVLCALLLAYQFALNQPIRHILPSLFAPRCHFQ